MERRITTDEGPQGLTPKGRFIADQLLAALENGARRAELVEVMQNCAGDEETFGLDAAFHMAQLLLALLGVPFPVLAAL